MRKFKILCIPPYDGMRRIIENIAEQRADIEFIIQPGGSENALSIVEQFSDKNIDAILSRGCTAETIQSSTNILTYDIAPSAYDVLRVLRAAEQTHEKYAIVGYQSISHSAEQLRSIIQYDFPIRTVHSYTECLHHIEQLKSDGYELIVGDTMAVNTAQDFGLSSLMVSTGIESINAAISTTIQVLKTYDTLNHKINLYSNIIDAIHQAVLVYDAFGNIHFDNCDQLPEKIKNELKNNIPTVIARNGLTLVRRKGDSVFNIKGKPCSIQGSDFCVFEITHTHKTVTKNIFIKTIHNDEDLPDTYPIEYYLGNSQAATDVLELCNLYSQSNRPILLLGDRGTGKDRFAYYIYKHSNYTHNPMFIVDSATMDDTSWKFLLEDDDSPLNMSELFIFINRIQIISEYWQQRLLYYLKNSSTAKRNRIVFCYSTTNHIEPDNNLYLYLRENVNCLRITLPSLSDRPQDIPMLIGTYTNAINIQHNTQILGFTPNAATQMQNHHWIRNIDQLYQAVQELALASKNSFISVEQVNRLLANRKYIDTTINANEIDLNRSLQDIEREIVKIIYESENMNQSNTAKRLGISRTTVWKLLK